ncbi:hypothetical protein M406DRAFT_259223 [Cryphonectria parasitica EP155]|uniref:DNA mismatch repair protein MSH5 n=1 Tax=Cryphonectria parasitica (strain ATCC 38755 / EP155) TaxID=660469 RepID=A0A9P5CP67_CRYP1|nr:uncharacterized protein M406DRAFT_259223 [Cryphonectria parasitica EP155]KAF3764856.1 hypothetical protein M406DRAFT_259223 [Cryphonectria parasitica EP155]
MAIDMKDNGTVGCAYYVAVDETLFLQEDIPMAGMEFVETLLLRVEPTTVLISLRSPGRLVEFLEAGAQDWEGHRGNHNEDFRGAYILRTLGSSKFNYESAKSHLMNLDLDALGSRTMHFNTVAEEEADSAVGGQSGSHGHARLLRLATFVNLDSRFSVGCAGAVLSDVQRRRAAEYLPNDPDAGLAFRVRSIEMFTLSNAMFVNADALTSLQILGSEHHPNYINQGLGRSTSGAKEGLSVYGLFHVLTHTARGKLKLRQMFLRPSIDLELIHERQRTISVFLRAENNADISRICKILRRIKNIKTYLVQLKKGANLTGGQSPGARTTWATLQAFSAYAIELREAVSRLQGVDTLAISSMVVDGILSNELRRVGELIATTIDFAQSKESCRTCVLPNIDPRLDDLKRTYDGLDNFLNEVAAHLISEIPEWGRPHVKQCIFYPQLGFLTAVSLDIETRRGKYDGEGDDEDVWEAKFMTDGVVYYKNRLMRALDVQLGDLYGLIIGKFPLYKEIEIVYDLGVKILRHEQALLTASDVCGELDSLLALALGADKYKLTAPQMTTANVIQIKDGRHPLQELVVPSFIANDTLLAGGSGGREEDHSVVLDDMEELPNVMVMTGPNHSGKSVYLKQVALIVFLAHIGSFVPAARACIGLTDRLLTRIATRESVSRNESAFAIDLKQAAFSINFATRRSLILIDEFGKGTNSMDGAGLMTALIDHFLGLSDEAPKVLAATHFHEIFEHNYLSGSPRLYLAHMDVRVDLETENREDQVTFLFRLTPGRCASSFGSRCAAMNGVDEAVVQRSDAIALLLARGDDLRAACARLTEQETEKLEEAELVAREFLEMNLSGPSSRHKDKAQDESKSIRAQLRKVLSGPSSVDESTR